MLYERANQLLAKSRKSTGQVVLYRRGNNAVQLQCGLGRGNYLATGQDGAQIEMQTHDWICQSNDLILAGQRTEPARGDLIEVTLAGRQYVYEVLPGPAGTVYSYSDSRKMTMRIHTKLRQGGVD